MKKLIIVAGLVFCLCGCGIDEPTSETVVPATEEVANVVESKKLVLEPTGSFSVVSGANFAVSSLSKVSETKVETTTEPVTEKVTEKIIEKKTERKTETPTTRVTEEQITEEIETEVVTEQITDSTTEVVTEVVDEVPDEEKPTVEELPSACGYTLQYSAVYYVTDNHLTRSNGSIRFDGHRETWYSTNEGCGQTTARSIPGKHVADDGTIRDCDGYICVASSDYKFYTVLLTSVGPAKVYDCGCSHGTVDVYTNW